MCRFKCFHFYILFSIFLFFNSQSFASHLEYCLPQEKIDFNPYREISDGRDLAYLWLLRSFISTVKDEDSIFEKYSFLPNNTLVATIKTDLVWPNGSKVTPEEVAYSIARTIKFRPLGDRVSVRNVNRETKFKDFLKNESFKKIDSVTFSLSFDSQILNFEGTLREALSTNSRHNRFWPVPSNSESKIQVLGKFDIDLSGSEAQLKAFDSIVKVVGRNNCKHFNFTIYPEMRSPFITYKSVKSPSQQSLFIVINPKLSKSKREKLYNFAAQAMQTANSDSIVATDRFFHQNEPGFNPSFKGWKISNLKLDFSNHEILIANENAQIESILKDFANKNKIRVKFEPLKSDQLKRYDLIIHNSGIIDGRHIILQDLYKFYKDYFPSLTKNLLSILKEIAATSAMTLPPNQSLLRNFELEAANSYQVMPIARRYIYAFSSINSKLEIAFNEVGEITFQKKVTAEP